MVRHGLPICPPRSVCEQRRGSLPLQTDRTAARHRRLYMVPSGHDATRGVQRKMEWRWVWVSYQTDSTRWHLGMFNQQYGSSGAATVARTSSKELSSFARRHQVQPWSLRSTPLSESKGPFIDRQGTLIVSFTMESVSFLIANVLCRET